MEDQAPMEGLQREWQTAVTPHQRDGIVQTIVRAMYPSPGPVAMNNPRIQRIVAYARKVESDIYGKANSMIEYYNLFVKKTRKIEQDVKAMREQRKKIEAELSMLHSGENCIRQQGISIMKNNEKIQ